MQQLVLCAGCGNLLGPKLAQVDADHFSPAQVADRVGAVRRCCRANVMAFVPTAAPKMVLIEHFQRVRLSEAQQAQPLPEKLLSCVR